MNALRGTHYMVQESLLLPFAHHLSQCSTDSNGSYLSTLSHRRNNTELLQQAQVIAIVPVFHESQPASVFHIPACDWIEARLRG
jgi:hypothetical protein